MTIDCRSGETIADPSIEGYHGGTLEEVQRPGTGRREGYGGPPGMARAIDHKELPYLYGDRGWADFPREYEGNTASSMSQFIERSA